MNQKITGVDEMSPAFRAGIRAGDILISISGEEVMDIIDYEKLTAEPRIKVEIESGGIASEHTIEKNEYEPLGLNFESSLMSPVRSCKNHCLFCFIDQLPHGGRETLHFKDDDWRLSLIMGNYVTLTNVSDAEFERIVKRRVSPLYVSVHATNGDIRRSMMRNPSAVNIMDRLRRLHDEDLRFHSQIVVCPGINDGDVLKSSLDDLYALRPASCSVAAVPVGLTKFRDGLAPLRKLTPYEAGCVIDTVEAANAKARKVTGEGFAYASDEMYVSAGRELPSYEAYDDFPQIENGVGLLRKFEHEFTEALEDMPSFDPPRRIDAATGESAYAFLSQLFKKLEPHGISIELHMIKNDHFGDTVTVAGLVTAGDISAQLGGSLKGELLILPDDMLRERDDVFLDGHDTQWLEKALGKRVLPLCAADGEEFIYGLFDGLKEV